MVKSLLNFIYDMATHLWAGVYKYHPTFQTYCNIIYGDIWTDSQGNLIVSISGLVR